MELSRAKTFQQSAFADFPFEWRNLQKSLRRVTSIDEIDTIVNTTTSQCKSKIIKNIYFTYIAVMIQLLFVPLTSVELINNEKTKV